MTFGPHAPNLSYGVLYAKHFTIPVEGFSFEFLMTLDASHRSSHRYNIRVTDRPPCLDASRAMGPEFTNLIDQQIWLANPLLPTDEDQARYWAGRWARGYLAWINRGIPFELPRDNGH